MLVPQGNQDPTPAGRRRHRPRRHHGRGDGFRVAYQADLHRRPVALNANEQQGIAKAVERGREQRAASGVPLAPARWRTP
jgi:hypothetical protein